MSTCTKRSVSDRDQLSEIESAVDGVTVHGVLTDLLPIKQEIKELSGKISDGK